MKKTTKLTLYGYHLNVKEIFIEEIKKRDLECGCTVLGNICPFFRYIDSDGIQHSCLKHDISNISGSNRIIMKKLLEEYKSNSRIQEEFEV